MNKSDYVSLFNSYLKNIPVTIKTLINAVDEYLDDMNYSKKDNAIQLLSQQPDLMSQLLPEIIMHMCKKYTICYIMFNNKILMYYE